MTFAIRLVPLLLLSSTLCLGATTAAPLAPAVAPIIGHVHSADGGSLKTHENVQAPLKAGDTIQAGDVISTSTGSATLILQDGTIKAAVRLKPDTSVRVLMTPGKGIDTELKRGSLFSDVHNPKKRPNPFQIRTATAVMGVRGTIFFVKEDKSTFLCPCVGRVAVSVPGPTQKKEQLLSGTHHDRPVILGQPKSPGGVLTLTPAPMGNEHSDSEAGELEKILSGAI